jgi:hypothetical protein
LFVARQVELRLNERMKVMQFGRELELSVTDTNSQSLTDATRNVSN